MMADRRPQVETDELVEVLIHDSCEVCPYLPERTARMPLRLPSTTLTRRQMDLRLARGDRRSGPFLYRTECPSCQACEPIRIEVDRFEFSRSQKRVFRRGERELRVEVGEPIVDNQRVTMFNAHRDARGLVGRDGDIDEYGYDSFLVQSCCDSFEVRYRLEDELVGVAICDRGDESISAVYCHYNPVYRHLSLGTYSILKEIELCREWGVPFLYLGLYIVESPHMSYKANFLPHQRLIDGRWETFYKQQS